MFLTSALDGAITSIIFLKGSSSELTEENYNVNLLLRLVSEAAEGSGLFKDAVEHCITFRFPAAPTDQDMERHLATFYRIVVTLYDHINSNDKNALTY